MPSIRHTIRPKTDETGRNNQIACQATQNAAPISPSCKTKILKSLLLSDIFLQMSIFDVFPLIRRLPDLWGIQGPIHGIC